jgi:hypothetical protein
MIALGILPIPVGVALLNAALVLFLRRSFGDTGAIIGFETAGHRLAHTGSNAAVAMTAISGLQAVLARTADRSAYKNDHANDPFDQRSVDSRNTHEPASDPR